MAKGRVGVFLKERTNMITMTVDFDKDKFEKQLLKEVVETGMAEVKRMVRKQVTIEEFSQLTFTFDKQTSSVFVDGPDNITSKLNL